MSTAPTTECATCADSRAATYADAATADHAADLMAELLNADLWRAQKCPAGNWHIFQMPPQTSRYVVRDTAVWDHECSGRYAATLPTTFGACSHCGQVQR